MVRTPSCDKSGLRKGTWTPEEDRKLTAYVTRYGCWNWRQLPKYAGLSRCGKSCRLRWMNYLRPNIKRGNYTREEEEIIIRLHESLGNRWSAIAAQLPGRTDNEIKNHWHTNLKKRKSNNTTKQDFIGLSQPKKTRKDKIQPNIIDPLNSATTQIVESSTLSPKPSTSDFSSSTADNAAVTSSCSDLKSDDEFAFLEAYEAPCGNFWTEPFLADNYYMPFEFLAPSLDPLSDPLLDGELLYSYDVCDYGILNWQL